MQSGQVVIVFAMHFVRTARCAGRTSTHLKLDCKVVASTARFDGEPRALRRPPLHRRDLDDGTDTNVACAGPRGIPRRQPQDAARWPTASAAGSTRCWLSIPADGGGSFVPSATRSIVASAPFTAECGAGPPPRLFQPVEHVFGDGRYVPTFSSRRRDGPAKPPGNCLFRTTNPSDSGARGGRGTATGFAVRYAEPLSSPQRDAPARAKPSSRSCSAVASGGPRHAAQAVDIAGGLPIGRDRRHVSPLEGFYYGHVARDLLSLERQPRLLMAGRTAYSATWCKVGVTSIVNYPSILDPDVARAGTSTRSPGGRCPVLRRSSLSQALPDRPAAARLPPAEARLRRAR